MSDDYVDRFFRVMSTENKDAPIYCSLDTVEGALCFGHWIIECGVFLPYVLKLRTQYPSLKIALLQKKRYKLNTLRDFGIEEKDIIYNNGMQGIGDGNQYHQYVIPQDTYSTLYVPRFFFMGEISMSTDIFFNALKSFRNHFHVHSNRTKRIPFLYVPPSSLENYGVNNTPLRKYKNTEDIYTICKEHGVEILRLDTFTSLKEQIDTVLSADVILCDSGTAYTFNACLIGKNSTIFLFNPDHINKLGTKIQDILSHLNAESKNEIVPIQTLEVGSNLFAIDTQDLIQKIKSYKKNTRMSTHHDPCEVCGTVCNENKICFNPTCVRNLSYKLDLYTSQMESAKSSVHLIVNDLLPLLKDFDGTIFMTGIGKSAHIMKKCTATWQSLGIRTHTLLAQDIFHGDLGILKENDLVFYVSNSGNTHELIAVAKYIKEKLNVKQISISNNPSAELARTVDHSYTLCNFKIKEADAFNCAPSVSSVIFMMLFDLLGITLSEARGITKEQFKLNHPGGDIGKRI